MLFLSQGLQSRLDNSNLDPKEIKRAKEGQVSVHLKSWACEGQGRSGECAFEVMSHVRTKEGHVMVR